MHGAGIIKRYLKRYSRQSREPGIVLYVLPANWLEIL